MTTIHPHIHIHIISMVRSFYPLPLPLTTCQVYACGEGTNGRLGCGGLTDVSSPKLVSDLSTYVVRKVAVNTGGRHAMALTADGKVFSWGDGEYGQLGHGDNK